MHPWTSIWIKSGTKRLNLETLLSFRNQNMNYSTTDFISNARDTLKNPKIPNYDMILNKKKFKKMM